MFKDMRPNAPLYILHRGEVPRLETGSIVSVSQPVPKAPAHYNAMFPQQQEMVVDVRAKIGGNTITFEKLPAALTIADFNATGSNVVVSSSREAIRSEVEAMLSQSRAIIESVGHHESVAQSCTDILKGLDPSYAKDREQTAEIQGLNTKIADMEKKLSGIDDIKKMLAEQAKQSKKE